MTRRRFVGLAPAAIPAHSSSLNPIAAFASRPPLLLAVANTWPASLLDRLARTGTAFTRAYSPSPADPDSGRAAVLAGRYPHSAALPSLLPLLEPVRLFTDPGEALAEFERNPGATAAATAVSGDGGRTHLSAHVPLMIRHAGVWLPGAANAALVSTLDLLPGLFELLGIPVPAGLDGLRFAAQPGPTLRESVYCYSAGEWRMVIRGVDKLVVNARLEVTHFYNLGQDPEQLNNLASEIGHARAIAEMRAQLREWMKRTGHQMDPSGLKLRD